MVRKVLVAGSGGREHAMAWKLLQSPLVETVFAAPGNGGTAALGGRCVNVELAGDLTLPETQDALVSFAKREGIGLVLIGPEAPLAAGIADRFAAAGIAAAGPGAKAARLESSKAYAKAFMETYGVRAAPSRTFTEPGAALEAARGHFASADAPLVIKADGLAAGKGVVVTSEASEAENAVRSFMEDGALGGAGKTLVIEEFLEGKEVSVLAAAAVSGGKGRILPFVPARDHKRRFDNDEGPNTGGMGAIAPVPDFTRAAQEDFQTAILEPTLRGLIAEGLDYRGFLFFGLMVRDGKCYLLEYNVRLGDPETQAVLPLMKSDFAGLCAAIASGDLENYSLAWKEGAVCAPVAVASGYPGEYRKGGAVTVDAAAFDKTGAVLFAAGAASGGGGLITAGGRVLAVSAHGENAAEARKKAYAALKAVSFEGMDYRRDIGLR